MVTFKELGSPFVEFEHLPIFSFLLGLANASASGYFTPTSQDINGAGGSMYSYHLLCRWTSVVLIFFNSF